MDSVLSEVFITTEKNHAEESLRLEAEYTEAHWNKSLKRMLAHRDKDTLANNEMGQADTMKIVSVDKMLW